MIQTVMNIKGIPGITLIILGIVVLAYSGTSLIASREAIEFLGMRIETEGCNFIPPFTGAILLVGGIGVLFPRAKPA